MGPGAILVAIAVLVAIYGVWKYTESETSDYKKFVNQANTLNEVVGNLEKKQKELEEKQKAFEVLQSTLNEQALKIQEMDAKFEAYAKATEEVEEAQRKEIIDLRSKIADKNPVIKVTGPIPIEYYTRKVQQTKVPEGKTKILKPEEFKKLTPEEQAKYRNKFKNHFIKVKKQLEELSK